MWRGGLLLPPLILLVVLFVFKGGNVVWGDDVSMCPLFDKLYRNLLTFSDLWAPYQGHRIIFPRVVELLLGWATHWNLNVIIGFIYLTLLGDLALLCWLLRDLRPVISERAWYVLAGICSLSVFSTSQVAIWVNAFYIGPALCELAVLVGVCCLAKFRAGYRTLVGCILAGTVASYSFGGGLTFWVMLAPLLYVKLRDDPRWLPKTLLWVMASAAVFVAYFHHLGGNGTSMTFGQSLAEVVRRPAAFVAYWLTCAGASIFFLNGKQAAIPALARSAVACGAPLCGLAGLTALGWAVWRLWRHRVALLPVVAPWLCLGLHGVCAVGLIVLTRFGSFPLESAISSRYILFSQYQWLALAAFLAVLAPNVGRGWIKFLAGVLIFCYLVSYANGWRYARSASRDLMQARAEMLSHPTAATYHTINPDRDLVQMASYMEMVRRHHLALFHDAPAPSPPGVNP